jgi:WD40 repeat protein
LVNFYSREFALSPDGKVIAVEQNNCKDLCKHTFRLVSTEDFSELFTSSAQTLQDLPAFSSDGKYFALADLTQVATSGGGTEPAGGTVGIWTTSDFTKVSSFSVKFPFDVTGIAFSEDNNLLAIAQRNSIDIIDVLSGDSKANIADLCDSYQRKVMFSPSSSIKVLEHSDCSSGEWAISGSTARLSNDDVPDLSRIAFDENGNFKAIPYTYPVISDLKAYRQEYYFEFSNNDVLSFKSFDVETLDRHSCDLSLANGSLDCQSHAPEYNNGRYLGKDVILATDGNYYSYVVGKDRVDIYSFEDPSQIYYSIPFRDYTFDLQALDPLNGIVIYNIALSMRANRVIIQDMKNDRILEKWEGETFLSSIAFAENKKFGALCRAIGYTSNPNKDRLVIFDLSEKRTVYNTEFTCGSIGFSFTNDGSKVAIAQYYSKVILLNTSLPFEKQNINIDASSSAVAFSPDGFMLAVGCNDSEICFLDSSDGKEVFRLKAHSSITNLAFSKDGSLLATSSDWGLISLWAVPPFTNNARQSQPSPISSYTPSSSWKFDDEDNFEGWGNAGDLDNVKVQKGFLSAKATGTDPQIYSNEGLNIDAAKFTRIAIRMRVSSGDSAQIFFHHDKDDMSEERSKIFAIQAGNEFNTYNIDMSSVTSWTGSINQLRLDPTSDSVGATIDIDYIQLLSPDFSWDFDEEGNFEGWGEQDWQLIDLQNLKVENGYLSATTTGNGPQIYLSGNLGIDTTKFTRVEIRMRISAGDSAQVFFNYGDGDWTADKGKVFSVIAGTEFNTYVIDMGNVATWKGIVGELRLDPIYDAPGATIEIDYIHLLP